jgi:pyruvate dehydrogenase E2 component (dihydrolipoamide acetyltransferase)
MDVDIVVPPLSQTSDTLVLVAWLKNVGDPVAKGEALFEVETDKATLEVEAPGSGVLQQILAQPGDEVTVKSKIGVIVDRILASPRARRLADQQGVPLPALAATGPRGMIVERDVRAYLAANPEQARAPSPPRPGEAGRSLQAGAVPASPPDTNATGGAPLVEGRRVPLTATRKTIARRMLHSHQTTAPVTLTRDADATELVALRRRLLAELAGQHTRPTYTDFLVSIAGRCLKRHPHLNAAFDGDELVLFEAVHIGLAVDTDRGLVVPVLRDVEQKGVLDLARERSELVQRTLDGTVKPEELAGATFTLSNLGALGVDTFTPLLSPPQVAILGTGRIRPAHDSRQAMFLSLTFDHRIVDGAPAARLLADIAALIEHPDRVWL